MGEVQSFLEEKHRGHYRVFNLCSGVRTSAARHSHNRYIGHQWPVLMRGYGGFIEADRQYESDKFKGRVANFGFEDHKAPPLPLLLAVCQDMDAWQQKDPRNVTPLASRHRATMERIMCVASSVVCAHHTPPSAVGVLRALQGWEGSDR